MMEQLDGNIAVNAEKSQKSSLLSVEDWSAFNKELLTKKPSPLNADGMLEFNNPFGDKKNAIGKTENEKPLDGLDKLKMYDKEKFANIGDKKDDAMRQLKKEKAESSEDNIRQLKKEKALAGEKTGANVKGAVKDGSKPETPVDGGVKDSIKKPETPADGGVKDSIKKPAAETDKGPKKLSNETDGAVNQEGKEVKDGGAKEKVLPSEPDGAVHQEGKEVKDGGIKEKFAPSEPSQGLTPAEGKEVKDGGVKAPAAEAETESHESR